MHASFPVCVADIDTDVALLAVVAIGVIGVLVWQFFRTIGERRRRTRRLMRVQDRRKRSERPD